MKTILGFLFFIAFGSAHATAVKKYPVHLDLEAPSESYEKLLQAQNPLVVNFEDLFAGDPLREIVAMGKRNLDWLKFMNQHREKPLSFTIPGSLKGIPIDKPMKYSGAIMQQKYQDFLKEVPPAMKDILIGTLPFTENPPIAEVDYIKFGHQIDIIYQTTLRWQMAQQWLDWYQQNRINDIRGYYFLSRQEGLEGLLRQWKTLPAEQKSTLQTWLLGECFNREHQDAGCNDRFTNAVANDFVWQFHQTYLPFAKATFDEFYLIPETRPDFIWNRAHPLVGVLPFKAPGIQDIQNFLKVNIEDEWKWNDGWQLRLDFKPQADVHVEFKPGVVPHVNALAGNTIVMDQNTPLTEWDVQWTIRHEFGHILGFPDCYVEFYDPNEQAMISYQLDVDDLMCSRAGKLQEHHYTELRNKYLRD